MPRHALPALFLAPALLLAGCGDRVGDYPALVPTDSLLAEPKVPGHARIAASSPDQVRADLAAEGEALAVSSAQMTAQGGVDAELSRRAAALRERAAALSASDPACADLPEGRTC